MRQRAFFLLLGILALSGCGEQMAGFSGPGYQPPGAAPMALAPSAVSVVPGSAPGPMASGKVAILLPLSGNLSGIGQILLQAAQLALPAGGPVTLDVLDTAGNPTGAAAAAQRAVAEGDSLILGPLTSPDTAAVAPIAQAAHVPVLAFTNDPSQARPGVWPLGISPDQQVERLVAAAQAQGKNTFAALIPDTPFGQAMADALRRAAAAAGLQPPDVEVHAPGMASITAVMRRMSDYADRRGPIDAQIRKARAEDTAAGRREAHRLSMTPIPPPPFNVLLLADTGDSLQEIASLLPYFDLNRSEVQVIGPILWADRASASAAVQGAWFAAPDDSARTTMAADYQAKYGAPPPTLADLAYDAAAIARVVAGSGGEETSILTQPAGFIGTDGWLSLLPGGQVRRSLAVYQIDAGGPTLMAPAPQPPAAGPGM